MADLRRSPEDRDDRADDRDDAARLRDAVSHERDAAADQRDVDADAGDLSFTEFGAEFDARLRQLGEDLVDRFERNRDHAINSDDFPGLSPAGLARLRAYAADQRRMAELDRAAALTMLDEIRGRLRRLEGRRSAASDERHAAAQDRSDAAGDRNAAALDRDGSLQDRSQSAIERAQVHPPSAPPGEHGLEIHDRTNSTEAMVTQAQQKIRDSRERLTPLGQKIGRTVAAQDGASIPPDN